MPLVSVIVPAFAVSGYIAEALDSVLLQTFRDYEIVVVNDGSPDTAELERVLQPYAAALRYLRKENGGLASARNAGIRAASGEFLAFLDADDSWLPDYLDAQLAFLRRDPPLDLAYTDAELFGDPQLAGRSYMQLYPSNGPVTLRALLLEQCTITPSCTVVRREPVEAVGLFDESFRCVEDFDLWTRLVLAGCRMDYQRRALVRRRVHPGSLSADRVAMLRADLRVFDKLAALPRFPGEILPLLNSQINLYGAQLDLELGKRHLLAGQYGLAREELARSCRAVPNPKARLAVACLRFWPAGARLLARCWTRRGPRRAVAGSVVAVAERCATAGKGL